MKSAAEPHVLQVFHMNKNYVLFFCGTNTFPDLSRPSCQLILIYFYADESTSVLRKAEGEYQGHRSLMMRTHGLLTTMQRQDVLDGYVAGISCRVQNQPYYQSFMMWLFLSFSRTKEVPDDNNYLIQIIHLSSKPFATRILMIASCWIESKAFSKSNLSKRMGLLD